jgi:hypothetical protein
MKEFIKKISKNWQECVYFSFNTENKKVIKEMICAYNVYQENERDFSDYIYDMDNKDDFLSCVKGGFTIAEFAELYNSRKSNYFLIVDEKMVSIDAQELLSLLLGETEELVKNMLTYPHSYNMYIYQNIIGDVIDA